MFRKQQQGAPATPQRHGTCTHGPQAGGGPLLPHEDGYGHSPVDLIRPGQRPGGKGLPPAAHNASFGQRGGLGRFNPNAGHDIFGGDNVRPGSSDGAAHNGRRSSASSHGRGGGGRGGAAQQQRLERPSAQVVASRASVEPPRSAAQSPPGADKPRWSSRDLEEQADEILSQIASHSAATSAASSSSPHRRQANSSSSRSKTSAHGAQQEEQERRRHHERRLEQEALKARQQVG